jgi:hypothetical protein
VPGRNSSTICQVLLALAVLLLAADRALAYGGPGVDVTFIQTAMTLLLWALAAFSAVLMWPVYALLRMIRRKGGVWRVAGGGTREREPGTQATAQPASPSTLHPPPATPQEPGKE